MQTATNYKKAQKSERMNLFIETDCAFGLLNLVVESLFSNTKIAKSTKK
jgi:hypothetical protein